MVYSTWFAWLLSTGALSPKPLQNAQAHNGTVITNTTTIVMSNNTNIANVTVITNTTTIGNITTVTNTTSIHNATTILPSTNNTKAVTSQDVYTSRTISALKTLNAWYDDTNGLWNTTGWWNAGNSLTVLADFAVLNPSAAKDLEIPLYIQNTFQQAQQVNPIANKTLNAEGLPVSTYKLVFGNSPSLMKRGMVKFLNDFYDDEGWWALGLIRSYDVGVVGLGDQDYLNASQVIYEDMKAGASYCGGIYWSKDADKNYTNAIANELFLTVAASLANRVKTNKQQYLDVAVKQWNWFKHSGMINAQNLINDGLNSTCQNNGANTWTYNQGVILGGLVELYKATQNGTYLDEAGKIANAAITHLSRNGTLFEGCEPNCTGDGAQFKGVFMRNLKYLNAVAPQDAYQTFIRTTADTIWAKDRNTTTNELGNSYVGPYVAANAASQTSALDALIAAMALG